MKKKQVKSAADSADKKSPKAPCTLAIDIGGSGIKALTLDSAGKPINQRSRIPMPKRARPKDVVAIVRKLAETQPAFERVSVGFPGVVKDGITYTAANLGKGWTGFDLQHALEGKLKRPVRVANDCDIQGLGCVSGHGIELVITLGTGFGSVLFVDGAPVHLELAHHPFHRGKTYEEELGERALKKKGHKKWSKLLEEAISELDRTFNYDSLFIGGGNSRFVKFKLPAGVKIVDNKNGLLGGIGLWREAKQGVPKPLAKSAPAPAKQPAKVLAKASPVMPARPSSAVSTTATIAGPAPAPLSQPKTAAAKPAVAAKPGVVPKPAAASDSPASASPPPPSSTPPTNGSTQ
ncbi:MAG TPA: ROK family protein [Candidatus Binataceae bacterium]|jgi:polyphosphate glucokinase|nr:ROK family protein [Candidatus Binataceae bacterium]